MTFLMVALVKAEAFVTCTSCFLALQSFAYICKTLWGGLCNDTYPPNEITVVVLGIVFFRASFQICFICSLA
jgi:hypothetical protein